MTLYSRQEDGETLSKWQGNAIAGVDCGQDGHVVFYPTGQVLQQACAFYSKVKSEEDLPCSSTVIETGAAIRQFSVMGSKDAYHTPSAAKIYAAARGCTNCTIVAAPARATPDNMRKMQAKAKLSFHEVISHVAGSPHAEAEVALVTADGILRCWDPEGGIQTVNTSATTRDRLLRCEYSRYGGYYSTLMVSLTGRSLSFAVVCKPPSRSLGSKPSFCLYRRSSTTRTAHEQVV